MFFLKLIICLGISVTVQLLWAEGALAWGPAIHTVTALSALDGVGAILPSIAGIITSSPLEYIYGCLAADFFIGKGKNRRAGHPHNWEGGFKFLNEAGDDREAAFAYGFLSHLAADVVAHNFFVPNLINSHPAWTRKGHLYWEVKADSLVGSNYIKIARDVLGMDHKGCDELLNLIAGKRRNGIKTKKRIFTQSVKFSDYLYGTHCVLFGGKIVRWQEFQDYLALMAGLSCRLVKDFLSNPDSCPCLSYDPMGRQNLRLVRRRKRIFKRSSGAQRPGRRFTLDKELLKL
jgi:hypothetical protein